MASLLVDEAPEDLVSRFTYMAEWLSNNASILTDSILNNPSDQNAVTKTTQNANTDTNQQQSGEQGRDIEPYKGQHIVLRRSTIAQLTDPSGKSVSQHVIVLDSMIRSLNDSLNTTKQMHEDMKQVAERQV